MATKDPIPEKKPVPKTNGDAKKPLAKPAAQPAKPAAQAGDGKKPAPKPVAPKAGQPPAGDKKEAGPKKPAPKAAPVRQAQAAHGGNRKIGQVLIDLGFLDDDQLWDIIEEAKNTNQLTGQVAVSRGLITEEQ